MGSRGLLKSAVTRWGSEPASTAPCLISQPPQRLASRAVISKSTYHHCGVFNNSRNTAWPTKVASRPTPEATLHAQRTRSFTSHHSSTTKAPLNPRRRRLYQLAAAALALHLAHRAYTFLTSDASADARATLNKDLFTPCTVLANEPIAPSAFLLTVQLPPTTRNTAIVAAAHAHGLWSVEVKQPQLQIARNYTPLPPPPPPATPPTPHDGPQQLQFYVRRYEGGEVSSYLSRLGAGDAIEIRGPHLGFDLAQRLGTRSKVVFLAGGTGIAPALQAAASLLALPDDDAAVHVDVLWANRGAAECAGCARVGGRAATQWWWWWWWGWPGSSAVGRKQGNPVAHEEAPSAVVRQLRALQDAYAARGRTLDVRSAVDAEGTFIAARDIADAVRRVAAPPLPSQEVASSASCYFHSQRLLEHYTEESDAEATGDVKTGLANSAGEPLAEGKKCTCDGDGDRGKNLFIISGPDGFVNAFAGPKVWADGGERQGPVGGVIAELRRKDPETWKNWLVLKQ